MVGNFQQNVLSDFDFRHLEHFREGNKLNDIPCGDPAIVVSKDYFVRIELVHVSEVGIADSHNDDGDGLVRNFNQNLFGLAHIVDASICQDYKQKI